MCHRDRRHPNPVRSPQWYLRLSRRAKGPSRKGDPPRFLLACQKFSPRSGSPSQFTKLIAHTWPLQRWGLDIVGPLPTAQGNLKFAFVAVEYFTKWIEARVVSTITSKTTQKFFWQNIVCRFGVPSELTVDNGKQFDSQDFKDFCFSIGVVERANGKIFTAVKKMLLDEKRASGPICYLRRSRR
jgi:hypothetical protein